MFIAQSIKKIPRGVRRSGMKLGGTYQLEFRSSERRGGRRGSRAINISPLMG